MTAHWELFSHDADMGVRGRGATLAQAFEQAGLALTATVTDLNLISPQQGVDIHCEAPDMELLLVEWLNTLVYEMATRHMLFCHFQLTVEGNELNGEAWGEPVDRDKHTPAVEVKGATYTELQVSHTADGGWMAQCVIDV